MNAAPMRSKPAKPIVLPMALANFEHEERWVGWAWETRTNKNGEEKPTKPPRIVRGGQRGGYAMNDKPETWASWDNVCAAVAKGNLDGIGLQLLAIEGFVALDLDNVRDGHGEPLLPWADKLIHRAATYAEWTPSGTGARIIGRIDPKFVSTHTKRSHPEGGEFEVYANLDTGRYITVSGDRIEGVPDALSDITTLVIELMGAGNVSAATLDFNNAPPLTIDTGSASAAVTPEEAFDRLPDHVRTCISHGRSGDRSADFQSAVNSLLICGVSIDMAERIFRLYPNGPTEKYTTRLRKELDRSWAKAGLTGSSPGCGNQDQEDFEPTPLVRPMPDGDPYPVESLGPLQAVAEAVRAKVQAPIAIGAQSALSIASLAVQALADVETLAGYAPCSLFALTVARSGERKSSCDKLLIAPAHDFQKKLIEKYREASDAQRIQHSIWEAQHKEIMRTAKKDSAGAQADLEALGAEPDPPIEPMIMANDPTLEGLLKLFAGGRPSLGLLTDEGGGFVGGHSMNTENRLKSVAGFSKLWDGAGIDRVRAGDGAMTFYGRRLACHVMLQPVAAMGLLTDPIANGQGFLARFLICHPSSTIGTRLHRNYAATHDQTIGVFAQRIYSILSRDLPIREGTRNELEPRKLVLAPDAKLLLHDYADEIERQQLPDGRLHSITPFASKSAEQAARVAGVLTLYENADAAEVSVTHIKCGIELAQHYVSEALRLTDAAVVPQDIQDAETLRIWLAEKWKEPLISARAIIRNGPGSMRVAKRVHPAMKVLEAHGWLRRAEGPARVDGAQANDVWQVYRER